jgi:hypothetical protein
LKFKLKVVVKLSDRDLLWLGLRIGFELAKEAGAPFLLEAETFALDVEGG